MPSRKTEEIKTRVAPEEKSAWQHAAEAERVGLSELIRRTMNERVSAKSMTVSVGAGPEVDYPEHGRARSVSGWNTPPPECVPTSDAPAALSEDPVLDSLCDGSFLKTVPKRRTEECACGKPTWIYCGECGS